jgi:chemotaxis protein MotB
MSDDSTRPIIIKRKKVIAGGAHGGAWKIAYADFVTAMMAFFLLMWLLGSTAKGDLAGDCRFFQNPLKVSMSGGDGSGDATSVLQGGGKDLTRQSGQVKKGDVEAKNDLVFQGGAGRISSQGAGAPGDLKADIEKMIEQSPQLAQFKKQMLLDITSEGLRIQIVDEQNRPMFDSSSADLKPYTRDILRQIGKALNGVKNRISLGRAYRCGSVCGGEKGFRTGSCRQPGECIASRTGGGGMDDSKVLRVVGLASTVLFDKNDPLGSVNRGSASSC